MPDFDFTEETSVPLMAPFTTTSSRKFEMVTACPDCNLVWLTSVPVTEPLPDVSPARILIGMETQPIFVPSLTSARLIEIVCALVTPERLTVTCDPLTLKVATFPVPDVTDAPLTDTGLAKVTTTLCSPATAPVRHSTPGVPVNGRLISKSPAGAMGLSGNRTKRSRRADEAIADREGIDPPAGGGDAAI